MSKEQLPEEPYVSDTLGWIYYKKNIADGAISHLSEAVEKLPNNPIVHYHLGMAYLKKGEKQLAKKSLERALEIQKDFTWMGGGKKALEEYK